MEIDVMQLIGMIGVPGALCFLMMTKFQNALEKMAAAVENNTKAIVAMTAIVQGVKSNVSE